MMPSAQTSGPEFVVRGDNDYDLISHDGSIRVELSCTERGEWKFWNVVILDQRFGCVGLVGPGPLRDWLNDVQKEASADAS